MENHCKAIGFIAVTIKEPALTFKTEGRVIDPEGYVYHLGSGELRILADDNGKLHVSFKTCKSRFQLCDKAIINETRYVIGTNSSIVIDGKWASNDYLIFGNGKALTCHHGNRNTSQAERLIKAIENAFLIIFTALVSFFEPI